MLFYSIPPFRLPKEIVRKQIQALKGMGIRFEVGVNVDEKLAATIKSDSDAVFVAGGTWKSLKLGVPGEDGQGVCCALDYLRRVNSGEELPLGQTVIVIGGGSVAIDAARTARRTGSREIHIVCLETRDLASKDRMPALDREIREAEEEGVIIHPSLGIKELIAANGKAVGIETRKCTSVRNADGKFEPQYDDGAATLSLQGDSIIVAIGQTADPSPFVQGDKVFIGGDMAEGPSTVIQAVASAQKSVREIEKLLGAAQPCTGDESVQPEYPVSHFVDIPRAEAREISPDERIKSIHVEDTAGLSTGEIESEAHRCVSCGCLAVGPSDLAIALVALDASVVTTRRTLSAHGFFRATASSTTVLEPDELIKEIRIPKPPKEARQSYLKFTLRKPIDFAVVSVASVITEKKNICSEARIILGAVAPAPIRAVAAEAALKGKSISEEVAASAATIALADVQPLAMNAYKAAIAKALVRRSILESRGQE
jgi:CO/xanthine dehydrogenase FAD-binding subunit